MKKNLVLNNKGNGIINYNYKYFSEKLKGIAWDLCDESVQICCMAAF